VHARDVTLLLTTDLLSEGVNLQDAAVVIHLIYRGRLHELSNAWGESREWAPATMWFTPTRFTLQRAPNESSGYDVS